MDADLPAFPYPVMNASRQPQGLTKRELFAAMVMQGVLSIDAQRSYEASAMFAVKAADALITQLNASKGEG